MVEMGLVVWVEALVVGAVGVGVWLSPMGVAFSLDVLLGAADVAVCGQDESWPSVLGASHLSGAWHGVCRHR